ncbi:hypothetical protein WA026_022008 [Henosepilachna vigintioctopunctata]|uniref:GCK domain-containing protein n=1 Tax=Henosepilachna vigintioctopunctata TaxID=420089 RepID=A0AAW1V1K1_9CUCU
MWEEMCLACEEFREEYQDAQNEETTTYLPCPASEIDVNQDYERDSAYNECMKLHPLRTKGCWNKLVQELYEDSQKLDIN